MKKAKKWIQIHLKYDIIGKSDPAKCVKRGQSFSHYFFAPK